MSQDKRIKEYSIFHPLYMSFYSRQLYQDVAWNWKGFCLLYLLMLLSLFWIPEMIKIQHEVSQLLEEQAPRYVNQAPVITITNGEVSIDEPVPYFITNPVKETPFVIIDTSGQITSLDKSDAFALIMKNKILIKTDLDNPHSFDLSGIESFVIDRKLIYEWIDVFRRWFAFIQFPFVVLFSFLFYLVQVVLCALIGTFYAKRFSLELTFRQLMRLAAISFTPPIILQFVHSLLDIDFPYRGAITLLIALGYLYYAVGSLSEKSSSLVRK